jgi:hypothetical protein
MIEIIVTLILFTLVLYLIYNDMINDYNYNFKTFCKDELCSRLLQKESLDTIYKLYTFYNNLLKILPEDDIRRKKLIKRFDKNNGLFEVDPYNKKQYTSYTLNKSNIGMCMREKTPDKQLHDIETLKFVFLHELGHVCTDSYDHNTEFWYNFKWLLTHTYNNNLMQPINFKNNPIKYCTGIIIDKNPYFDYD